MSTRDLNGQKAQVISGPKNEQFQINCYNLLNEDQTTTDFTDYAATGIILPRILACCCDITGTKSYTGTYTKEKPWFPLAKLISFIAYGL